MVSEFLSNYWVVKSLVKKQWDSSIFFAFIKPLFSSELRTFSLVGAFYISLFFSTSNRTLLTLATAAGVALYFHLKNLTLTLFLMFIATLPFAKGQGFQIVMLTREQIDRYSLYNLNYYFSIYLSDFFLALLLAWYARAKLFSNYTFALSYRLKLIATTFFCFLLVGAVPAVSSTFPEVVLLTIVQLLKAGLIFFLPFVLKLKKNHLPHFYAIIIAMVLFQSGWVVLQRINNGPLGKDIEVHLPNSENGVFTAENLEVIRATGTFYEPSILGTFMLMNLGLLSYLLVKNKISPQLKKITLLSLVLIVISLVFTASRALYLLTVIFILLFNWHFKVITRRHLTPLKLLITGLIFLISLPFLSNRLSTLPLLFSQYGSGTYRLQMILFSLRLVLTTPLGVGLNLSPVFFATAFNTENFIFDPAYPHNIFVQVLAETGIVGLILFISFVYLCFQSFFRDGRNINEFGIASLVFLVCAQFYPIFINHPEILYFLFLNLGLFVYTAERKSSWKK